MARGRTPPDADRLHAHVERGKRSDPDERIVDCVKRLPCRRTTLWAATYGPALGLIEIADWMGREHGSPRRLPRMLPQRPWRRSYLRRID